VRAIHRAFAIGYAGIALLFFACAVALIAFASLVLWHGVDPLSEEPLTGRFNLVLQAIALLTIAVTGLELGQTVIEEEVQRNTGLSAPTRVRRFLSRFMIVVVVALSVETLVGAFRYGQEDPSLLPYSASVGVAAAALLLAWGVFVRLNKDAEELEPEAMAEVKSEDQELKGDRAVG